MKLLVAAGALLGSSFVTEVALPALVPPAGMMLPAAAAQLTTLPNGPTGVGERRGGGWGLFAGPPAGGGPPATAGCTGPWGPSNRGFLPPYLGDAWRWLAGAVAAGMPSSSQPSVGAIAVYRASPGYDVKHGHVAIVIAVGPSSFRVSEMNFLGLGVVDERDSPWPDWHAEGFIPR